MKNSILARPNLKVLLLGAMLIVVVQGLIGSGGQDGMVSDNSHTPVVSWTSDIDQLMDEAMQQPSSSVFMRISHYYEKQREYKKAILYLQKAERFAQVEELRH